MNKKEIVNHLQYSWWAYILTAVFVIGLWLTVFGILAKPKNDEKLAIAFIGKNFDDSAFEDDLPNIIESSTNQRVKEVFVESIYSENNYTLDTIIVTRLQGTTDLFIWEGELKGGLEDRYALYDENIVNSVLGEVTYHRVNGEAYAIRLNSENKNFKKYYKGSEDCWLLMSPNSVNFGGANGKGKTENDAAIQVIKYLLGVE